MAEPCIAKSPTSSGCESAITDDTSSDWEDFTGSGQSSLENNESLFQRVDSRSNSSRVSLLTMMIRQQHNSEPQSGPLSGRSQQQEPPTSDCNSTAASPDDAASTKPVTIPICCSPVSYSPRTTRRKMLASELTGSVRRYMLVERKQKTTSTATVFENQHAAHHIPDPRGKNQRKHDKLQTQTWPQGTDKN
ncbi:hypothetical protein FQN50_003093 [Emmonsiellopsis sp. PD_5]|nr:hypothetical protein FQN50_003093 [Emmonsiellopsis sp. PD_5]